MQHQKDTNTQKRYSNNIRYCIKRQGYTIQEVANEIGLARRTLTKYISGELPTPRTYLQKIAYTIGCDVEELLQSPSNNPNTQPLPVANIVTTTNQTQSIFTFTDEQKKLLASLFALDGDLLTQEQGGNNTNLSRRALLQELLAIIGLPLALSYNQYSSNDVEHGTSIINDDLIAVFENTMMANWELYYTGGAIRVAQRLEKCCQEIAKLAKLAQGTIWHHRLLVLLTTTYQLQSCVSRDMMNYAQANMAYQRAFHIAQELEDPELIASSLARQGVTLIQQERPKEAIIYLSGALDIIGTKSLPFLKGHTIQALAEAYAKAQLVEESWSTIGQAELYLVGKEQSDEKSLIRGVTTASIAAQKGVNAVLLHDYHKAISLIDESLTTYDPALIRGRARLIAQKAEAYYGLGIIDACTSNALAALSLARSAGSSKTEDRIRTLHIKLTQSTRGKEPSVIQLKEALSL